MNPVEEFILKQKGAHQELLAFLHPYFLQKGLHARMAYGLPFYYGKKWICYLKPNKNGTVDLSFTRANLFEDPSGLLESRDRRQIKSLVLHDLESLPYQAIEDCLAAALAVDKTSR